MDPRSQRRGAASVFRVHSVRLVNNIPIATLANGSGEVCQVPLSVLGGTAGTLLYVPAPVGSSHVVIRGEGAIPSSHMGSAVVQPNGDNTGAELFDGEFQAPENSELYPERVSLDDVLIFNSGSALVIGANGELVLRSKYCAPIRIEMPNNGYLRLTIGDDEPEERAMLGLATLDKLQELVDKVNDLGSQLASLASSITTCPTTSTEPGLIKVKADAASQLDIVYNPVEAPGEELVSGILRLSPLSEADRKTNNVEG